MSKVSKNEEILLVFIWRLKGAAYGVELKKLILEKTGKNWNYGTLYCTLDQLVKKGFAEKINSEPLPERGGRRKIYYQLTHDGLQELKRSLQIQKALWDGISELSFDKEENHV